MRNDDNDDDVDDDDDCEEPNRRCGAHHLPGSVAFAHSSAF